MPVYTNVQECTHNSNSLTGVKSINTTDSKDPLLSQADGKRADAVVGDLGRKIEATIEIEDQGSSYAGFIGLSVAGDLVFKCQKDSNKLSTVSHTISDFVINSANLVTNQDSPNSVTLSGRTVDEDDTHSVA